VRVTFCAAYPYPAAVLIGIRPYAFDENLNPDPAGVYFSAHWCPPCRGFTPHLRQTYECLAKEGKTFEVVFVSLDHSQQQFDEYYGEMPWAALPWDSNLKNSLATKFGVASM
jgi:nucleoredoxin